MYTGTRAYRAAASGFLSNPPPGIREPRSRHKPPPGHGLAGTDLDSLWDRTLFLANPLSYGRQFMQRMHHPFHEVLACLYLNAESSAVAYNSYFRGEKTSALEYLPTVLHTARQLGVMRVLLAHNPVWDADSGLPELSLLCWQLQEAGVELHDFLLIGSGNTLSLRAHGAL